MTFAIAGPISRGLWRETDDCAADKLSPEDQAVVDSILASQRQRGVAPFGADDVARGRGYRLVERFEF